MYEEGYPNVQVDFESKVVDVLLERYSCVDPRYANVDLQRETSIKWFKAAIQRAVRPCESGSDSLDQYKFITNVSENLFDSLTGLRNDDNISNPWVEEIRDRACESLHSGLKEMFWNISKHYDKWTNVDYHVSFVEDVRDGKLFMKNWSPAT